MVDRAKGKGLVNNHAHQTQQLKKKKFGTEGCPHLILRYNKPASQPANKQLQCSEIWHRGQSSPSPKKKAFSRSWKGWTSLSSLKTWRSFIYSSKVLFIHLATIVVAKTLWVTSPADQPSDLHVQWSPSPSYLLKSRWNKREKRRQRSSLLFGGCTWMPHYSQLQ